MGVGEVLGCKGGFFGGVGEKKCLTNGGVVGYWGGVNKKRKAYSEWEKIATTRMGKL